MFITVPARSSDAIATLQLNILAGVVFVEFKNGYSYEFSNVSRRAMLNLLLNPNMSLGFWVNANCAQSKRADAHATWVLN